MRIGIGWKTVSYTHLDVYKRQVWLSAAGISDAFSSIACQIAGMLNWQHYVFGYADSFA